MKYNSLVSARMSARRHRLLYSSIKLSSDVIGFESIVFLSFNYTSVPFHCGRSKLYYGEFITYLSKEPTNINYWQANTGVPTKVFFSRIYLLLEILHNFVNVNQKLFKWGLIDSPKCVKCENEDSILH